MIGAVWIRQLQELDLKRLQGLLLVMRMLGCEGGNASQQPDGSSTVAPSTVPKPSGQDLQTLTGHAESVTFVVFVRMARGIVIGSDDKNVKIWDASE